MQTNNHHLWWPRRAYKTKLERKFRILPCNVVRISVEIHNMLHALQKPPEKPSTQQMRVAIDRHNRKSCGCKEGAR